MGEGSEWQASQGVPLTSSGGASFMWLEEDEWQSSTCLKVKHPTCIKHHVSNPH